MHALAAAPMHALASRCMHLKVQSVQLAFEKCIGAYASACMQCIGTCDACNLDASRCTASESACIRLHYANASRCMHPQVQCIQSALADACIQKCIRLHALAYALHLGNSG